MATTTSNALYSPEVWEDLSQAEFQNRVVVANAATSSDTLVGRPGDTVEFPKWDTLSDLDDLTENVAIEPEAMSQRSTRATIKEAGKGVEITDTADLTGMGNPQDEAIRQFGVLAARKVDADLITAATASGPITLPNGDSGGTSSPLSHSAPLTWGGIVGAIEQFGDDFELSEVYGLFVRSSHIAQLHQDDQFIAAAQTQTGNDIIRRGFLGQVGGMNVFVTDRLGANKAMIVKSGALGVLWKRRPIVEQDRDILKRTNVVTTNLHYAVKRLNDRGVLDFTVTANGGGGGDG